LDAHHSFSARYPLATLDTILRRNRFDGSILVAGGQAGPPLEPAALRALPEFVRGAVIEADHLDPRLFEHYQRDGRFLGLCWRPAGPAATLPDYLGDLQRRRLTLDLWGGLSFVPGIAGRFPALRMAIVHLGCPAADSDSGRQAAWKSAMETAAQFPQVACKLSGLLGLAPSPWSAAALRPFVLHALAVFGPERLMFGSGWPDCLPEHTWKETLAAFTQSIGARPVEMREQLLGGAAARFYGIVP
jgi:hypothetical protein